MLYDKEGQQRDSLQAITAIKPKWREELHKSNERDEHYQTMVAECLLDPQIGADYRVIDGMLKYKGKLVVGSTNNIRNSLLKTVYDTALGEHLGQRRTYQKLKALFYWEGMKQDVITFVSLCDIC